MKELIVYFSTQSNNTHRFVQKLDAESIRIPMDEEERIKVDEDYVLIVPTYSGGKVTDAGQVDAHGAVPKQVIHFLNDPDNRKHCLGVISSGNTNFGDSFAIAGPVISYKLKVPLLYQFELIGTKEDVEEVNRIITETFNADQ